MPGKPIILFWRRTDVTGLERLILTISADTILAESTVICVEDGGFRLDHRWRLTADWQAQQLDVERLGPAGRAQLSLERTVGGWCVNGQRRPDLDGAEEPAQLVPPPEDPPLGSHAPQATGRSDKRRSRGLSRGRRHSHSIVPGGFDVTS